MASHDELKRMAGKAVLIGGGAKPKTPQRIPLVDGVAMQVIPDDGVCIFMLVTKDGPQMGVALTANQLRQIGTKMLFNADILPREMQETEADEEEDRG